MKPGRELDRLIAEKVMGWRVLSHWEPGVVKHLIDENQCEVRPPEFKLYSTSIAAAWEVVERMPVYFRLTRDSFGWSCWYKRDPKTLEDMDQEPECVRGETAPHAISLAALGVAGMTQL